MIRGNKFIELCPELGFRRLQITFGRKTHLAEVDTRIAKYLTSIFDDVTLYPPIKHQEEIKPIIKPKPKPKPKPKKKVVDDKSRDSSTNNP
jgi:hypothetical protein